ncbi:hypothetical protein SDC49_24555 [Lactobacillus sp. R2/2]|nr:hypothetical protein [Lactobacillus sp. R2/2]
MLGGTIFILGLILLFIARAFGLLAIGVGIAFSVLGYYQQKQVQNLLRHKLKETEELKSNGFYLKNSMALIPTI